jgi:hypothetical protein
MKERVKRIAAYLIGVVAFITLIAILLWIFIAPFLRGFFWLGCLLTFLMLSFMAGMFVASREFKRRKTLRLNERDEIELDNVYKTYFADAGVDKACFEELWREIAETLHFPAKKIRPEDRFDGELGPVKFNDKLKWIGLEMLAGNYDDNDDLAFKAEGRKKKMKMEIDINKIQTVRDYVLAFGTKGF